MIIAQHDKEPKVDTSTVTGALIINGGLGLEHWIHVPDFHGMYLPQRFHAEYDSFLYVKQTPESGHEVGHLAHARDQMQPIFSYKNRAERRNARK